jgi:hypothetical protein
MENLIFTCIKICPNFLWMYCFILVGIQCAQNWGECAMCAFSMAHNCLNPSYPKLGFLGVVLHYLSLDLRIWNIVRVLHICVKLEPPTPPITKQHLCTSCKPFFEITPRHAHNQTLEETSPLLFAHLWLVVHTCVFTSPHTTKQHLMAIMVGNFFHSYPNLHSWTEDTKKSHKCSSVGII